MAARALRQVAQPLAAPSDSAPAAPDTRSFTALGVPASLVSVLTATGILAPFPIQTATLVDTLAGRDVLGRGRTGSGKTLAFAIPTVARLSDPRRPRVTKQPRSLILVPTRELATQIRATLEPLAKAVGLRTAVVFGGVAQGPQVQALAAGVDIVIACPGRLEDLLRQRHADLSAVEITILDEADHMADLGFLPTVRRILDRTPARGQRMLFSATLDNAIDVLVKKYLSNPLTHSVDSTTEAPPAMTHHVFTVTAGDKGAVVRELASGRGRSLLFTRTKHAAKKLARQLSAAGITAADLHGNLSQGARERHLADFASGAVRVLVATDIAARGIHVDDIELVVHVDPPTEHKAYLHRSGRTARAGAAGVVVTVMTADQRTDVTQLMRLAKITPTLTAVRPGDGRALTITGPAADLVIPPFPVIQVEDRPEKAQRSGRRPAPAPRTGRAASTGRAAGAPVRSGQGRSARAGNASPARGKSGRGRSNGPTFWTTSTPAC